MKCVFLTPSTYFLWDEDREIVRASHPALNTWHTGYFIVLDHYYAERRYRDYFMVGECVRFLFTSCEGSLNERVSAANE